IKLLEQAAKLLYREWFVHLRFPGHDTTPITNGLPQGWKDGSIGDVAEVKSGFAFKSKDWQEQGHPVIKIKNITGNGGVDIEDCQCVPDAVAEKAVRFRIQSGSILVAMTGATVGKIGVMPATNRHYYLNQRVGEFQSRKKFAISAFLFSALNADSVQSQVNNLAAGAAQPNISAKQIESLKITLPTDELLQRFSAFAEAGFKQSLVLQLQNQKLAEARDILLPRLMNGEVAV
ncbi:MAG: restriction endonuclease subunit S, partial [Rickettsiales bacterium]